MKKWTETVNRFSIEITDLRTGEVFELLDTSIAKGIDDIKNYIDRGFWDVSQEDKELLGLR